jgi:hypothetical protein
MHLKGDLYLDSALTNLSIRSLARIKYPEGLCVAAIIVPPKEQSFDVPAVVAALDKEISSDLKPYKKELIFSRTTGCGTLFFGPEHPSAAATGMVASIDAIYDSIIKTQGAAACQKFTIVQTTKLHLHNHWIEVSHLSYVILVSRVSVKLFAMAITFNEFINVR